MIFGLGLSSGSPRSCGDGERRWSQPLPTKLSQFRLMLAAETDDVGSGRPYPERERLPPFVEAGVLDCHRESVILDLGQTHLPEEIDQVSFAGSGQFGFIGDVWIELSGRLPEDVERTFIAGMVPDTGSHRPARTCHPLHLAEALAGVGHEMDHQLSESLIENSVLEGKLLRARPSYVHFGKALVGGGDELL